MGTMGAMGWMGESAAAKGIMNSEF